MSVNAIIGHGSKVSYDANQLSGILGITPPSPDAASEDATDMDSTNKYMESIPGLIDPGEAEFECEYTEGQSSTLWGIYNTNKSWVFTLPDDSHFDFTGRVTNIETSIGGPGEKVTQTVTLQVVGEPTFTVA